MKVFGNPNQKKQELKNLIKNLTLDERYLFKKKDFRKEILKNIDKNMTLLDVGKSMRDYFDEIVCVEKKTLDINIFENLDFSKYTTTILTFFLDKFIYFL